MLFVRSSKNRKTFSIVRLIEKEDWNTLRRTLHQLKKNKDDIVPTFLFHPFTISPKTNVKSPSSKDLIKITPLHLLCLHNTPIDIIKSLVKIHPTSIQTQSSPGNEYPLHYAIGAKKASKDVIKLLIKTYPHAVTRSSHRQHTLFEPHHTPLQLLLSRSLSKRGGGGGGGGLDSNVVKLVLDANRLKCPLSDSDIERALEQQQQQKQELEQEEKGDVDSYFSRFSFGGIMKSIAFHQKNRSFFLRGENNFVDFIFVVLVSMTIIPWGLLNSTGIFTFFVIFALVVVLLMGNYKKNLLNVLSLDKIRNVYDQLSSEKNDNNKDETTKPKTTTTKTKFGSCVICWDGPADHALLPCGHICLCSGCADHRCGEGSSSSSKRGGKCPVCSCRVKKATRVFDAGIHEG